jgi:REP-associated tyrosine transposase
MAHSYTCLLYHLVFSTKSQEPGLHTELRPRLWEYLGGAIRGEGSFCILANGVADHVHLLACLRQDKAVSEVLSSIKANSSGWIHDEFPQSRSFHWQDGYGAFTVSKSQRDAVRRYIAGQEAHHQKLRVPLALHPGLRSLCPLRGLEMLKLGPTLEVHS